MPFRFVRAICFILALAGASARAEAGPISVLYLTTGTGLAAVQGTSLITWQRYNVYNEWAIAVDGTVRTASYWPNVYGSGYEYDLALGAPLGSVAAPNVVNLADGTTDGQYNYGVAYNTVYRFGTDWSGGQALFNIVGPYNPAYWFGITYDPFSSSLWVLQWQDITGSGTTVAQFSLAGTLLSSFSTRMTQTTGLAMDYADGTLWLSNEQMWFQFATDGTLLGSQAYTGTGGLPLYGPSIRGAEFAFTPQAVPEPGTLALFGTGLFVLARRRVSRSRRS